MARRMLKLRQVEESADNIHMQQRFMIVACIAKVFCLMQMDAHGCDRRLNVLMAANAFGERTRLASWLETESSPVILRLFDF